jgi:hypothetical protein
VDVWENTPFIGAVLTNNTDEIQQFYIRLDFRSNTGRTFSSTSKLVTLSPRQTLTIDNTNIGGYKLIDWRETEQTRNPELRSVAIDVLLSGIIPEGAYTICGVLLDLRQQEFARLDPCAILDIMFPEQPMIIVPDQYVDANAGSFVIQWTQTGAPGMRQYLRYKLRMVELLGNQSPDQALLTNRHILDDIVLDQTQYRYMQGLNLPLVPYFRYVLQVTQGIINGKGQFTPFGQAGGISPASVFTYGTPLDDITLLNPDDGSTQFLMNQQTLKVNWQYSGNLPNGLQYKISWAPWNGAGQPKNAFQNAAAIRSYVTAPPNKEYNILKANIANGWNALKAAIVRTSDQAVLAESDPVGFIAYTSYISLAPLFPPNASAVYSPAIQFRWQRAVVENGVMYHFRIYRMLHGETVQTALSNGRIVFDKLLDPSQSSIASQGIFGLRVSYEDMGMTEGNYLEGSENEFVWQVSLEMAERQAVLGSTAPQSYSIRDPLLPKLAITAMVWDTTTGLTLRDMPVELQPMDGDGANARPIGQPFVTNTNNNGIAQWQFWRDSVQWNNYRIRIPRKDIYEETQTAVFNWRNTGVQARQRLSWNGQPLNAYRTVTVVPRHSIGIRQRPLDVLVLGICVNDKATGSSIDGADVEVSFFDPVAGEYGMSYDNRPYRNATRRYVTNNLGICVVTLHKADLPSPWVGISCAKSHYYEGQSPVLNMHTFSPILTDTGVVAAHVFSVTLEKNIVDGTVVDRMYNTGIPQAKAALYKITSTQMINVQQGKRNVTYTYDTTKVAEATADASGRFEFYDVPDSIDFFIEGDYFNIQANEYYEPARGSRMRKNGPVHDYRIELVGYQVRVEGQVACNDQIWDDPVSRVTVNIWGRETCNEVKRMGMVVRPRETVYGLLGTTQTDENGHFTFDRIPTDIDLYVTVNFNDWHSDPGGETRNVSMCGITPPAAYAYLVNDPHFKAWAPIQYDANGTQIGSSFTSTLDIGEDRLISDRYHAGTGVSGQVLHSNTIQVQRVKLAGEFTISDEFNNRRISGARVEILDDTLRPAKLTLTTDANGFCRTNDLPYGRRYWVRVSAPAYDMKRVQTAWLTAPTTSLAIGLHQQKATIRGRVKSSQSLAAIGGARVELYDPVTHQRVAGNAGEYSVISSNDSGSYILGQRLVNQGNYVSVIHPGAYIVRTVKANYITSEISITLTAGEQRVLDILMDNSMGSVAGRVMNSGNPIAGAVVQCGGQLATSNQRGEYSFEGIAVGLKFITCTAAGFKKYSGTCNVIANRQTIADLPLEEESWALGVVVFRQDQQGQSTLAGAQVRIEGMQAVQTDANGVVMLSRVPTGSVTLIVEPPAGQLLTSFRQTMSIPMPYNLNLMSVVLRPAGTYNLTVTSQAGGAPIPNADVVVENGPEYSMRTNAQGIASLKLPEGRWNLRINANGYLSGFAANVQVRAGQTANGTVTLVPSGLPADLFYSFPFTVDSLRNTASGMVISGIIDLNLPDNPSLKLPGGMSALHARFTNVEIRNNRLVNPEVALRFSEVTGLTLHGFSVTLRNASVTLNRQGLQVPLRINLEPLQQLFSDSDLDNIDFEIRVGRDGVQFAGNSNVQIDVNNLRQQLFGIVLNPGNTIRLGANGLGFDGNMQLPVPSVRAIAFRNFVITRQGRISMDAIAITQPAVSFSASIFSVRLDTVRLDGRGFALSGTIGITGVDAIGLDSVKVFGLRLLRDGNIASIDGYRIFGGFTLANYRIPNNENLSIQIGADNAGRLYAALRGDLTLPGLNKTIRLNPLIVRSDRTIEASIPLNENIGFKNVISLALQRLDIKANEIVLIGGLDFSIPGLSVQVGNFHFNRSGEVSVDSIRIGFKIEPLDIAGAISWGNNRFTGALTARVSGIGLDLGFSYQNNNNYSFAFVLNLGSGGIQVWAPPPILVTSIGGSITFANGTPTIRLLGEVGVGVQGLDNLLALDFTRINDPSIGLYFTGSLDGPVIGGGTNLIFQLPGLDELALGKVTTQLNLGVPSFTANLDASVRLSCLSLHGNYAMSITKNSFGVTSLIDANFVVGTARGGWTLGRNIRHNSTSDVAGFDQYARNVNGFVANLGVDGDIDIYIASAEAELDAAFWLDVAQLSVGAGMKAHLEAELDIIVVTVGVEGNVNLRGEISKRRGIVVSGSGDLRGEACIRYPCFSEGICKECWSRTVGVDVSYNNGDFDAHGYVR